MCLLLGACSFGDDGDEGEATGEPAGSADPTTTAAPDSTVPPSTGTVTVGDDTYEIVVTCIAPGAGEVLAVGVGESDTGERVEAYVQAFLGEPYIGLEVGGVRIEPSFDGPLDLYLQDDAIRASAIRFVSDLDIETGDGTFVGLGAVDIRCASYGDEADLPPTAFG